MAKMTPKQRATAKKKKEALERKLYKERSARAKRGWETRRKNEAKAALVKQIRRERRLADNTRKVRAKSEPKKSNAGIGPRRRKRVSEVLDNFLSPPRLETKGKTKRELAAMLAESERRREYLEEDMRVRIETEDFVDVLGPQWLHEDFSIAVQDSRVRHTPFAAEALKLMRGAVRKGKTAREKEIGLKNAAYWLADYLDVPLREIFTLYYSP